MTPKKQFEYKKGIAVRINNPDGYNKFKVNSEVIKQDDIDLKQEAKSLAQDRQYAGDYLNLYACEDRFDQDLCILAQKSQIDVIILRAMIGSFQTVCEILDTRSRKESFANLVYIA